MVLSDADYNMLNDRLLEIINILIAMKEQEKHYWEIWKINKEKEI